MVASETNLLTVFLKYKKDYDVELFFQTWPIGFMNGKPNDSSYEDMFSSTALSSNFEDCPFSSNKTVIQTKSEL